MEIRPQSLEINPSFQWNDPLAPILLLGTSVDLLEKVYSHFVVSDNPNLFSGHTKREKQIEEAAAKQQMSDLLVQNAKLLNMVEKLTKRKE